MRLPGYWHDFEKHTYKGVGMGKVEPMGEEA